MYFIFINSCNDEKACFINYLTFKVFPFFISFNNNNNITLLLLYVVNKKVIKLLSLKIVNCNAYDNRDNFVAFITIRAYKF